MFDWDSEALKKELDQFLKDFKYESLTYDGIEIIAYDENNEPFCKREYLIGSKTRQAFEDLEAKFVKYSDNIVFAYENGFFTAVD